MSNERDDLTDRLLRQSLRPAAGAPASAGRHVEAEVLAAWAEGGLEPARASDVELHLSSCAECQSLLAAFSATEPALDATVVPAIAPFWQRWALRWALPVAAGAIGVVIWSVVRVSPPADAPPTQMARVEDTAARSPLEMNQQSAAAPSGSELARKAEPSVAPPPSAVGGGGGGSPEPAPSVRDDAARGNRSQELRQDRLIAPAAAPVEPPRELRPEPAARDQMAAAAITPTPPPPPSAPAAQFRAETAQAVEPRVPVIAERVESVNEVPAAAARPFPLQQVVGGISAVPVIAEFSSAVPGAALGVAAGRGGGRGAPAEGDSRVQVSAAPPPPPVRWRVFADGTVQRAPVGSEQWEAVVIDPPGQVTTGAAPSPTVVWLGGRGGVVLRSTNGRTFTRVSSPAPADITSVSAVNAAQATVTTVDGRTFTTTDAGASWR